jgi:hypothetical protein
MSRRELIDTGTDKRFVRRDAKGPFKAIGRCSQIPVAGRAQSGENQGEGRTRRPRRPASADKARMKIATFNVNGINSRLPVLLRWLSESRPDIACLQELKAPQGRFPEAAIRAAGYGAIYRGQKAWNGVAILARGAVPRRCNVA